jgi:molybdopterin-guanine dinucleotide biosynthesis protein A
VQRDDPVTGVEDTRTPSVSGVILAGGKARRMGGVNKAFVKVGGRPIIERVVSTLSQTFTRIIIITNCPDSFRYLGLPMYTDIIPGSGSLGGLYTGLKVCGADYGFLVGCDMPFLRAEIIRRMVDRIRAFDVIVPEIQGYLEPLHALYSQRCVAPIEDLIHQRSYKIFNLFHEVRVNTLPESFFTSLDPELSFIQNVNSPNDLARAEELAARLDASD